VIPFELMEATSRTARDHGLSIHIDGARIWNAVAATGIDGPSWAGLGDTIQFCFSKGLGAPIGSIVCGDREVIEEIRYLRKRYGGGMRQTGVIAAAARATPWLRSSPSVWPSASRGPSNRPMSTPTWSGSTSRQ
jgi:threonine aldolase